MGDDIDEGNEKYQFTWPGKADSIRLSQSPTTKTLLPSKEDSKNWDTTENLYIEGDNLEVLKQLQKTYHSKVDVIYIDPPYNTDNDFVYNDKFAQSVEEYKNKSHQESVSAPEVTGRYHTNWLNMMYPRLLLARNLLSKKGTIFISIDYREEFNLKKICDEIFGEDNFINAISVEMSSMSGPKVNNAINGKKYPKIKETILIYSKNKNHMKLDIQKVDKDKWDKEYNMIIPSLDKDSYENIINTKNISTMNQMIKNLELVSLINFASENNIELTEEWKRENSYRIFASKPNTALLNIASELEFEQDLFFLPNPSGDTKLIKTDFNRKTKTARIELLRASETLKEYMGDIWFDYLTSGGIAKEGGVPFNDGKKPLKLLDTILKTGSTKDSIILDFFSGSATTGHSVMKLNKEDKGNRKFILVQLPQEIEKYSETYNLGYRNICDIGKDRLKISGKQIEETIEKNRTLLNSDDTTSAVDTGFKVFRLEETNIIAWDGKKIENKNIPSLLDQLEDVIKEDRTHEDVVYEIMLKYGVFDMTVEEIKINNKPMYDIGKGYMLICLEENINNEDVVEIGNLGYLHVVFNDKSFENDNVKLNAEHTLKNMGVEEVVSI